MFDDKTQKVIDEICKACANNHSNEKCADFIQEFLRSLDIEKNLSAHTIRAYASDLRDYITFANKNQLDALQIDYKTFRWYLSDLELANSSKSTLARKTSAVKSFFKYLNANGIIENNPTAIVSSARRDKRLPRITPYNQIEALLSVCDTQSGGAVELRDQAFLELLYATGARISEVANLQLEDINFKQRCVSLFGKGSKQRFVPLHQTALDFLEMYIKDGRPELLAAIKRAGLQTNQLFISTRGKAMSADSLRIVFKKRARQAGLDPSFHPHDMRHAFATDMLDAGTDLRSVQEMLGHASLSTTQIYTDLSIEHIKKAYNLSHPRAKKD